MTKPAMALLLGMLLAGCSGEVADNSAHSSPQSPSPTEAATSSDNSTSEAEIRQQIEQLVFSDGDANNRPIINPNIKVVDSEGNTKPMNGESDEAEKQRQKFNSCREALNKLYELKGTAFPFLVEHLDDERQSINFRNHFTGNSVGDACYCKYILPASRPSS